LDKEIGISWYLHPASHYSWLVMSNCQILLPASIHKIVLGNLCAHSHLWGLLCCNLPLSQIQVRMLLQHTHSGYMGNKKNQSIEDRNNCHYHPRLVFYIHRSCTSSDNSPLPDYLDRTYLLLHHPLFCIRRLCKRSVRILARKDVLLYNYIGLHLCHPLDHIGNFHIQHACIDPYVWCCTRPGPLRSLICICHVPCRRQHDCISGDCFLPLMLYTHHLHLREPPCIHPTHIYSVDRLNACSLVPVCLDCIHHLQVLEQLHNLCHCTGNGGLGRIH
jgi:hypothetical protein